jgi:hypothetical protein
VDTIKQISLQEANEERYGRTHVDARIRQEVLENPAIITMTANGVAMLEDYRSQIYSYESKQARIAQIQQLDLHQLVVDIFVGVAHIQVPALFTGVCAQLAGRLKFDTKVAAVNTLAEMLAVLCMTDAFDISKASRMASLEILSRLPLSEGTLRSLAECAYLPPMVCEPNVLTHNRSGAYLLEHDSLILGNENHHNDDICLDVLNIVNSVPLALDTQFLSTVEEVPTFALDTQEKVEQWSRFKEESYALYSRMVQHGNRLYMTHKVDKRGRIYAQGYHLTTQGTSFKKAMLELADAEVVQGVPT